MKAMIILSIIMAASFAQAKDLIITGTEVAKALNLKPVHTRADLDVVVLKVTEAEKARISTHMHKHGKCGGFELVDTSGFQTMGTQNYDELFVNMKPAPQFQVLSKDLKDGPEFRQEIADSLNNVSPSRLETDVTWMSSYPTRKHNTANKNDHVNEMKRKLQQLAKNTDYVSIDLIDHSRTGQKTVRAVIKGSKRPDEIVAMGAHFDSINQSFFTQEAPGADDDASGSANIMEVFRLMLQEKQPERSLHFFWYAAEEVGLVGSAEVAQSYKAQNKDVISVLQLDMTLYPGSGKFTMGMMTDFTNAWFNAYLKELNRLYVKAKIIDSKCGYGCSDHASWHRQGFAAAIPFESTMEKMNKQLHTTNDVISSRYDFEHSAQFSKLALAYALSMANSTARPVR